MRSDMHCHSVFETALNEVTAISDHAGQILRVNDRASRELGNAIARSGLVLLCGYVEGYIRELAEEAVDELSSFQLHISDLPYGLFCSVVEDVMGSSSQARERAVDEFKHAWSEGKSFNLNRKKLASTGGNPTVDTVENIFSTFGVAMIIDRLSVAHFQVDSTFVKESQSEALKAAIITAVNGDTTHALAIAAMIDEKWKPRTKRRSVGYVSAIQEMLKRRNRIAHGEGREIITPEELTSTVETMRQFGRGLHDVLTEQLSCLQKFSRVTPEEVV